MYSNAGNAVPERYQTLVNFDGAMSQRIVPPPIGTLQREECVQKLLSTGTDLEKAVMQVFANHISECRAYIIAKGETPSSDVTRMAAQVCILRAQDIANQGRALDVSDEMSLQEIERTEQGLQDINSPDAYSMLSFPVQASVKICLDKLSDLHVDKGGSGKMVDTLYFLRSTDPASASAPLNSADGLSVESNTDAYLNCFSGFVIDNNLSNDGYVTGDAGAATGSILKRNNVDGDGYIYGDPGTGTTGSVGTSQDVSGDGGFTLESPGSSTSSGIFGFLTTLMNNAGNLATSVKNAANSTAGAAGAVKNAVSNVGANAISTYIQQNKSTIIFAVIVVVLLIVVIIYAAKRKR